MSPRDAPTPRARPMRSRTRKTHTAATLHQNHGRRHHARLRRCQATQLTKNRMCRASSCMTGSKVSTSSGGKKRERCASANRPKAKKLSMHSLKPVTMKAHSGWRGAAVFGLGHEPDAVGRDQVGQHLLVAPLLEPVERDGLAQQRIGDRLGIARDADLRLALGLHRDVPDRQGDEPVARLAVEPGPIDHRRLVRVMGVEQHPAEGGLVPLAAGADRPWCGCRPAPRQRIGGRNRGVIGHRINVPRPVLDPSGANPGRR